MWIALKKQETNFEMAERLVDEIYKDPKQKF